MLTRKAVIITGTFRDKIITKKISGCFFVIK